MAKISYVKKNDNTGLLRLGIVRGEESFAYTVDREFYNELGMPERGGVIDDEMLSAIETVDERLRAREAALSLLSYADNNEKGLFLKLRRKGFGSESASTAVNEMTARGYINEERQLLRIVQSLANDKLKGPKKIIPALVSKGYPSSLVKSVVRRLCESGEVDFELNSQRLVEKKLGSEADREEIKELLFKNGY